ncbi:hypothetical protein OsJ_23145 [Oryza sativa Japonica Group]|uniref:Uncharacterized protein n=1 Tax=Oryza sativa subsp. japonica TaxID=39947 RepID=B9FVK5_ORYSJ|nr:hypothetical protein OsJ_23145 [Oryza sativa Japonica Group]
MASTGVKLIDIAVNFTDGMFRGIYHGKQCHAADIPAVLARARAAGVDRIIIRCFAACHSPFRFLFLAYGSDLVCLISRFLGLVRRKVTGGSLKESREALEIAETDGRLFCMVGVHPTRCGEFEESGDPKGHFQALLALAKEGIAKGKVVAVGECGLDYDRLHFCPSDVQKKYFKKQFELAEAVKLPMFLHMRAAGEDFCEIVSENLHSENFEVLQGIPAERMMIETDSPYCDIKNTHAGIKLVKSVWPSKKKEKYEPDSTVKGRNEACLVR